MKFKLVRAAALLLSPVVLLAVVPFFGLNKPFRLKVNRVHFGHLPRAFGNAEQTVITVFVGYEGRQPGWWRKGAGTHWLQNFKFVDGKGKAHPIHSYGMTRGPYDEKSESHLIYLTCALPEGYKVTPASSFQGTALLANSFNPPRTLGVARFSAPVQFSPSPHEGSQYPFG